MNKLLLGFSLLSIFCGGCATPDAQPHVDNSAYWLAPEPIQIYTTNRDLDEALIVAIEMWNAADVRGVGYFEYVVSPTPGRVSARVSIVDSREGEYDDAFGLWHNGEITIKRPYIHEVKLIAHELGHVLGFGHSNDPQSLMHDYVAPDALITEEILDILATKE